MQLFIDRETRDALRDDCRSDIEGISDLKIDTPEDRELVHDLWCKLKQVGPLLDQIGWEPEASEDRLAVKLNTRRTRSFVTRHLEGWKGVLDDSVITEADFRRSIDQGVQYGWPEPTPAEFAEELAQHRAGVDKILDSIALHRRLLDVFELAAELAHEEVA